VHRPSLRDEVRTSAGGPSARDAQAQLLRAYLDLYVYATALRDPAWLDPHFAALGARPRTLRFEEDLVPLLTFMSQEANRLTRLSRGTPRLVHETRRLLAAERSRVLTGDLSAAVAAVRPLAAEEGPLSALASLMVVQSCREGRAACQRALGPEAEAVLSGALGRARRDPALAPLVRRLDLR
jgi:hypothetical protein